MNSSYSFRDILNQYKEIDKQRKPNKPDIPKLSKSQSDTLKSRLKILTPQFKKAIGDSDLKTAKFIIVDLQQILRALNKYAKLVEYKNQLFELALEQYDYQFAIDGFLSNRRLANEKTRLHLESTALLAIAYLRQKELEKAKPFIKEVLQNKTVIKTEGTRERFNREIIARFDEECALYSLIEDRKISNNSDEIHQEVLHVLDSLSEEQTYNLLGKSLPKLTRDLLFEVDRFSKNQLTYQEQKLLTAPEEVLKDEEAGRTVFSAFKRVVYNSLCDPKSEVYKAWYTNAVGSVVDKKYITVAVAMALGGHGIGITALLISVSALVIRFGLDIYCDRFKPSAITEFRRKS